jgi:hypothetical protein
MAALDMPFESASMASPPAMACGNPPGTTICLGVVTIFMMAAQDTFSATLWFDGPLPSIAGAAYGSR